MTVALIPSPEEMSTRVAEMPPAAVLATFCRFVSATQTDEEKAIGSTILKNKAGVSKAHAERSVRLLKKVQHRKPISETDIIYARKILVIYRRQVMELGLIA